jgi:hypothetical protein
MWGVVSLPSKLQDGGQPLAGYTQLDILYVSSTVRISSILGLCTRYAVKARNAQGRWDISKERMADKGCKLEDNIKMN